MKSILLVLVWVTTLAAGIGLGYLWRDAALATAVEDLPVSAPDLAEEFVIRASKKEVHDIAECDRIRAQMAQMQQENAEMGQTIFQMTLKQIINSTTQPPHENYIETHWQRYMERSAQNSGWRNLDNMLNMMMELARYSDAGIPFLEAVIHDPRRNTVEREAALQMMAHLPHAAAFNTLLDFRDESIMELDYPYDLVMRHVANLDTAEVAPRIPEMIAQIQYELGMDNFSPERPTVLFYLADRHDSSEAEQLLFDERILRENVQDVLHAAQESHSALAQEVIEAIAGNHPDDHARRSAENMLQRW